MDILIKNMEMPKKDDIVIMTLDSNGRINVFGRRLLSLLSPHAEVHGLRVAETDAIELPEHGDLIDRNKLPITGITDYMNVGHTVIEYEDLKNAPTIVEANNE